MKNAKKVLVLLLCAVILIGASIAGTVAYLTDSKEVVNTFTVGKVNIKLEETGATERNNGTVGLDLHLLPGIPVEKDPTVTVLANSEDCYLRVLVTVDVSESWQSDIDAIEAGLIKQGETFEAWAGKFADNYLISGSMPGFNAYCWTVAAPVIDANAKTILYTITYKEDSDIFEKNAADIELPAIFDTVKVPADVTNDQLALLGGMEINVVAQAIQAEGFGNAAAAWAEFSK